MIRLHFLPQMRPKYPGYECWRIALVSSSHPSQLEQDLAINCDVSIFLSSFVVSVCSDMWLYFPPSLTYLLVQYIVSACKSTYINIRPRLKNPRIFLWVHQLLFCPISTLHQIEEYTVCESFLDFFFFYVPFYSFTCVADSHCQHFCPYMQLELKCYFSVFVCVCDSMSVSS